MSYELELDRAVSEIDKAKAKTVLVQLPDGLKPRAKEIKERLEGTGAEVLIWGGSCYGACDVPSVDVDILIQFGHSRWENA
jgi:2-(3-amino-3-carboxypropyl)histidine synthase